MHFKEKDPPRPFEVGNGERFFMHDCGTLKLDPDEQVTLVTGSGAEYDVARKAFGFYATPSLNGRLCRFGLKGVLVKNRIGNYFVMLVENGREELFENYLSSESLSVVCWMDTTERLNELERRIHE